MKIAVIIDLWAPVIGGSQTHVREISTRLVEDYGCRVDIFTRSILDDQNIKHTKTEEHCDRNLRIIRTGPVARLTSIWGRAATIFSIPWKLRREHKNENYDFIHAHSILAGAMGKLASILISKPVIFTVHGSPNMSGNAKGLHYVIEKAILTGIKYDGLISAGKDFVNYKNVNKDVKVIPNGVNLKKFDEVQNVPKGNSFKILFVGRLDWPKGLSFLFKAIKILKENNLPLLKEKKVEFHIVGYGFDMAKYKKQASDLDINDMVFFRGKMTGDELVREFKSSSLFVLPSICEGQPITILEAMASKLPVLTTFAADSSHIVTPDIGWKIDAGEPNQIAEKIIEIIQLSQRTLECMGEKGHHKIIENFTWDLITRETVGYYKSLRLMT